MRPSRIAVLLRKICSAVLLLGTAVAGRAQISIVASNAGANEIAVGNVYVQSFNSLVNTGSNAWTDNSTLSGWYAAKGPGTNTANNTPLTNLVANAAGTNNTASGTLYSLAQHFTDNTTNSGFRALGGAPSGGSGPLNFALRFVNNTGTNLTGLTLSYELKWAYTLSGTNLTQVPGSNSVILLHRTFAAGAGTLAGLPTNWTTVASNAIVNSDTSIPDNWNHYVHNLTGVNVTNGGEFWLDWRIAKLSGSANNVIVALDNVRVADFTTANPAILTPPLDQAVRAGNPVTFSVVATGSPEAPVFQWRKNSTNLANATNASFTIAAAQEGDAGNYSVVASNSAGSVTSAPVVLTVYAPAAAGVKGPPNASLPGTSPVITYTADTNLQEVAFLPVGRSEKADLYLPNPMPAPRVPAVIVIHGGGGSDGDKAQDREVQAAMEFASRGYVAMSINYKRTFKNGTTGVWSTAWPQNIKDAKTAVRWLRANAAAYNIDTNRIGAIGFSWGGNEATMLATTRPADGLEPTDDGLTAFSSAVQCASDFYGAVLIPDYHNMSQFGGTKEAGTAGSMDYDPATYLNASPATHAHSNAAPILLCHGTADTDVLMTQSYALRAALLNAGARVDGPVLVPGGKHSYSLYETNPTYGGSVASPIDVRPQVFGFFDRYLIAKATNTPPSLSAISNYTINAGFTLLLTNAASDTEAPPQVLAFALLTAPTNATLGSNSGVLTWRPLVAQADSTNPFAVVVTDNGTPNLSATQQFNVTVNPLVFPSVSEISASNGGLILQVTGTTGPDYTVQVSTDLAGWTNFLTTNSPAVPLNWTDTNADSFLKRFYRVLLGP